MKKKKEHKEKGQEGGGKEVGGILASNANWEFISWANERLDVLCTYV